MVAADSLGARPLGMTNLLKSISGMVLIISRICPLLTGTAAFPYVDGERCLLFLESWARKEGAVEEQIDLLEWVLSE